MINITNLIIGFIVGFVTVYLIKRVHIKRVLTKKRVSNPQKKSFTLANAYQKAVVFFPIYYLPIWIVSSIYYFSNPAYKDVVVEGIVVAVIWFVLAIVLDIFIWIYSPKKEKNHWKEIYIKTQPWTLLMYYTILISPIIVVLIIYKKQ